MDITKRINVSAPINSVSFGFCGWNILKEFFERDISIDLFPQQAFDWTSFNKSSQDFKNYITQSARFASERYSRHNPEFKLWHPRESEKSIGKNATLMTFFELDSITAVERNILNNYDKLLVTSKATKQVFEDGGIQAPIIYCPLGFDKTNFVRVDKPFYRDNRCVFSIFGKFEKRKHHQKAIQAWLKRYGRNRNYMLHAHIYNPFWRNGQEDYLKLQKVLCNNEHYYNVVFQPYVSTLSDLNLSFNATSIVIDMSGGEGFSLPSFHALGLGKHAVIHDCSAMQDWANNKNSVLVPSIGKIEAYDGTFFRPGDDYNQGNIFDFDTDAFIAGCEKAEARWLSNPLNVEGLKLQQEFTWAKTAETILESTTT